MEPSEVMRRFEEAIRRLPMRKPIIIVYQQFCPYSLGLTRRELGLLQKLVLMERVGKVDLEGNL